MIDEIDENRSTLVARWTPETGAAALGAGGRPAPTHPVDDMLIHPSGEARATGRPVYVPDVQRLPPEP